MFGVLLLLEDVLLLYMLYVFVIVVVDFIGIVLLLCEECSSFGVCFVVYYVIVLCMWLEFFLGYFYNIIILFGVRYCFVMVDVYYMVK